MRTEKPNEDAEGLHEKSTKEVLKIINSEDKKIATTVEEEIPEIEKTVEIFARTIKNGGSVYYVGAGTSGRLGILDASEIPPTFGLEEDKVVGLIAGGKDAIISAKEGREDDKEAGKQLIRERNIGDSDMVIGISASGRTPFVLGCLEEARSNGSATAGISNNSGAPISKYSDITFTAETGPEIIAGSTRMKAGTAQKMILNMISTAAMVKLGKVYDNFMVDLVASNEKLKDRAKRILKSLTGADEERIKTVLKESDYEVKPAVLAIKEELTVAEAREKLTACDGYLGRALGEGPGDRP